jgi:AcrR family transcriptional regulator
MSARDDLLDRIVDDVAANGIADRSLREIAESVGSSHRMVLYHFGSRDGLVTAIVEEVERRQRVVMSAGLDHTDPAATMRDVWHRVAGPQLRPFVQLFFEALAYSSRHGAPDDHLTASWVDATSPADGEDALDARLGVAVIRGLLVDVLAGGDPSVAHAALERYIDITQATRRRSAVRR